ncbi:MAG: Signal peptidase I [uncultured Sphingosinicella sp.]|uniref:Signal peptidase I n=1 Tax=uncultured Sphingosinicella sp. TaxID=478748 RepID=A0A6J4UDM1_9SPHN|nr:signal peptidase I [uncultured Sphingosinicella sp.]CAA9544735.1 MAG: Signal peptidase I [uncultured Sphingosinicella sp.]
MSASDPISAHADQTEASEPEKADAADKQAVARKGTDWWGEVKAIFWLVLAVLAFHSFVAKPFYIPSESMMPVLLKGDRLVVSKYPYGWSWVSPSFHIMPATQGRLLGSLPERGDIVIVTPPGKSADYIKRVVGLPGDELEMINGELSINGIPVKREERPAALLPIDDNLPCFPDEFGEHRVTGRDGNRYCRLPVFRETLPNGRSYDTIDMGYNSEVDDFAKMKIPDNHVFLMGDNRDKSADSRVALEREGLGGPVPYENIGGRAEFVTFSLDGTSQYLNPVSWVTALRGGRAGSSLHPSEAGER